MGEWVTKKLKEIAIIKMGQSPESLYVNEVGIGVPFLQGNAEFSSLYPKNKYWVIKPTRVSKTEDILLSVRAPVGETNIADREYCIGRGLSSIEFHIDKKFGWYLINKEKRQLKVKERGSTFTAVNKKDIETIDCFFPEEKIEQSKIAEILTTIDDAIEKTERIIAKYRRIKQGLLQDLLTKGIDENGNIRREATHEFKDSPLGRIPVEWEFGTIGEVAKVRRGASPRPIDNPEYFSDIGRGWVRITDVTNAYKFLLKTSQYMSLLGESLSVKVNKGELILSICATVGKPIILGIDACIHDGFVHIYDYQKRIDRDYLFYFLDYNQEKIKLKSQIGTQGNLNTDIVKNIELIIPPYKEQLTISETLTNIDNNLDIEQKNLKKLHSIKQGLMQDLLTGKVRVTHLLNKGGKSNECHP